MRSSGGWTARLSTRTAGRTRRLCAGVAVAGLALAGLSTAGAASAGASTAARAGIVTPGVTQDETTASDNNLRDGWDPNEPGLTPAVVGGSTFGRVFKTGVKGQVYAQPLVIGSTVVVATEEDWVYGLNATTGAIKWSTQLGAPYHITSCQDLTPDIGVTSTPVYDPSTNSVYVMALVNEVSYEWHLFGVNVSTGAITLKQRIAGSPTNDSHISFSAIPQDQRASLLLMHGWVYAAFASHCDHTPYAGYVAGVNIATHATTLWTDEAGVSDEKGGIWQGGGGLMSDGSGRIFFTSGNGISPPKAPGHSPPGQVAESVVRLAPQANGSLKAEDFFSPANAPSLDAGDVDYGAGGPVELPVGTQKYPNVVVQAGKDGHIFLLNANNLGGREQAPGNGNANLFRSHPVGGQWGHPAVFEASTSPLPASTNGTHDDVVYLGKDDNLREYQISTDGTDTPSITDVANSSFTLGYTSGSPVITSNGTNPSSAVIWVVDSSGSTGTGSSLDAFSLVPNGNRLTQLWSGGIGTAAKFSIVATANGMVYVGTRDGDVYGFGVTTGGPLQRSGTVTYPDTQVGSASSAPATVTAMRTVTVTGASVSSMSTPAPYTMGQVTETGPGITPAPVKFPVTLHKGDALHAQVAFAPTAPGGSAPAQVTFATSTGSGSATVPLVGDGLKTGLYASSPALSFVLVENDGELITNVPVGIGIPQRTNIVNGGATPVTVTSVSPPTGPFVAQYLPKVGTVIKPGQDVPVQITYAPTQAVTSNGSFTITGTGGTTLAVTLTGTGLPAVTQFTASPSSVNFGSVPVGHTATQFVHVVNAGNQPSLMQQTALPGGPFGEPLRVANGLPVNGGYDLVLPVTFRPNSVGTFTGVYRLRWTDRFGTHMLNVPITGTGVG